MSGVGTRERLTFQIIRDVRIFGICASSIFLLIVFFKSLTVFRSIKFVSLKLDNVKENLMQRRWINHSLKNSEILL